VVCFRQQRKERAKSSLGLLSHFEGSQNQLQTEEEERNQDVALAALIQELKASPMQETLSPTAEDELWSDLELRINKSYSSYWQMLFVKNETKLHHQKNTEYMSFS